MKKHGQTEELSNGGDGGNNGGGTRFRDYSNPLDYGQSNNINNHHHINEDKTDDLGDDDGNESWAHGGDTNHLQTTADGIQSNEVSDGESKGELCSDIVRYEPKGLAKDTMLMVNRKRRNKVYSNWNLGKDIGDRPPIVFNGTFPIDAPISSRFMLMKNNVKVAGRGGPSTRRTVETIEEEASSSEGTSTDLSAYSDIDKRLEGGHRNTKCRALIRRPIDSTKSRLRRRTRAFRRSVD